MKAILRRREDKLLCLCRRRFSAARIASFTELVLVERDPPRGCFGQGECVRCFFSRDAIFSLMFFGVALQQNENDSAV